MFPSRFPLKLSLLLMTVLLALAGCNKPAGVSTGLSAPAAAPSPAPSRIISTAPSSTEIILSLGFAGSLIAVDPYSAALAGLPDGLALIDFAAPDAEAIIGLEPDLIVSSEINRISAADDPFKLLRDLGIPIVYIPTSDSIAGIYQDIGMIAEALGAEAGGRELVSAMQAEIAAIAAQGAALATQRAKRSVYFEISPFPYPYTFGSGTYLHEMLEIIGAENIFAGQTGWFAPSVEAVIRANPEVILSMDYGDPNTLDEIRGRDGFGTIAAVAAGRVYTINGDTASRPSPGIISALWEMARAVYPGQFD
ncbi:MAG: ABC transporter substrate-binding protein [Treponema sp.]|jgi:iron complex transport system substrate-binding protein|nr:ABC transporter substrate-binding protein [Treponema sp.]